MPCCRTKYRHFSSPLFRGQLTDAQRASFAMRSKRLDDLTATTIHGFCQAILHTHGVQAGLDPGARVVDEAVADALFPSELSAWFSRRLAAETTADDPIVVLARGNSAAGRRLIRELAILRREHPDAAPMPPIEDARPDIAFVKAVDDFERWQSGTSSEWARAIARELRKLAARYSDTFATPPDFAALWKLCDAGDSRLFEERGCSSCLTAKQRSGFGAYRDETVSDEARTQYAFVRESWNELSAISQAASFAHLSSSLDPLLRGYHARKRAAAVLDFDDLLLHVRDLVRSNDDVRMPLGGGISSF